MRAARRAAALVIVVAAAIGLAWGLGWIRRDAAPVEPLPGQAFGPDAAGYRDVYIEPAEIRDGKRRFEGRNARIMAFERNGRIGLCGYVMAPADQAKMVAAWLAQARIAVDGQRVAAGFVTVVTPDDPPRAGCVATPFAWPGDAAKIELAITGTPLTRP
jgi:hypothetical protein